MKKTKKIWALPVIGATTLSIATPALVTSCSTNVQTIKNDVIDQFKKLTVAAPHCSNLKDKGDAHNLRMIKNYYKNLVEREFGLTWVEQPDGINKHYNAFEGNAYFDIPASNGCEDKPTLILQGHIDMVFANLNKTVDYHDYKIILEETEIDGKPTLHSKDFQTSIGADDGIGIASMLALAKNKDSFKQGKISCLFTTDEDVGMVGAEQVPTYWFINDDGTPIEYLINVDGEDINETDIGCSGSYDCDFKIIDFGEHWTDFPASGYTTYKIEAKGFHGGHSSNIGNGIVNPISEIAKIVKSLNTTETFKLCEIDTPGTVANNAIPSEAFIEFAASGLNVATVQATLDTKLAALKAEFTDEVNATLAITTVSNNPLHVLDDAGSKAIINFIADLFCGRDKDSGEAQTNANISPVNLKVWDEKYEKGYFYMCYKPRSFSHEELDKCQEEMEENFESTLEATFPEDEEEEYEGAIYEPISDYPPWVQDENNPFTKILLEGYKNVGITPKVTKISGGIEPTIWYNKQNALNMGAIGPTVLNAHNVNETIYLDTIEPLVKIILYAIDQLANKNASH